MRLIGKGAFTKAYLLEDGKVFLRSMCWAKEALALFPVDGELFPKLEQVDCGEYKTEYYPKTPSLKKSLTAEDYKLYMILRDLFKYKSGKGYHHWYKVFSDAYICWPQYHNRVYELLEYLDNLANYDSAHLRFEISPRNVRTVNGKLLLLDCFFFENQLDQVKLKRY